MKKMSALYLLAAIAMVGCGKSNPLTDEQKAKVKEVLSSMNSVTSSSQSAQAARQGKTSDIATTGDAKTMADHLAKAECQFDVPKVDPGGLDVTAVNLKVSGDRCPILLEMGMSVKMNGNRGEAKIKMLFEVKDAEFAKLTDISKFNINATITGDDNSASGPFEGAIHSKKYGEIKITGSFTANENETVSEMTYQIGDLPATLKAVQRKDKEPVFYVNGEEMNQERFQASMGNSSPMVGVSGTNQSTSSSSLSYNLTENGCSTGNQTFDSEQALCAGLESDSRNNSCALGLRQTMFTSRRCSGTFTRKP